MEWSEEEPYNDLPDLPPAVNLETLETLKLAVEARAALAAMDQASLRLPNPSVLLNALLILEAQASSEIENIVTTADELFKYAQDESSATDPATREALRYRAALFEGFETVRARTLNVSTAVQVCSRIKLRDMDIRKAPGTYIGNPQTRRPVYIPPVGEQLIRDKLANWERFVHDSSDIDPLITMAVSHYQFEAIHPFEDANGRTGRVLNVLVLVEKGLLQSPILYLSKYIIETKNEYYRLLLSVTAERNWLEWITYMLEGVRRTALDTIRKIDAILELQSRIHDELRAVIGTVDADLLNLLFEQPYCRIRDVVSRCEVSRPTASKWLTQLSDAGVVRRIKSGRELLFVNTAFIDVLKQDVTGNDDNVTRPAEPRLF